MEIEVRAHDSIRKIAEAEWNALSGVESAPFLRWAFLDALERTGCVGEETGWLPHHLTLHRGGVLVAAAPAYVKTNSEGEFVFDYAWAGASERAGIPYYPKLVVAIPFTPASSQRLFTRQGEDATPLRAAFAEALRKMCEAVELSSAHVLFASEDEARTFAAAGLAARYSTQFHWKNAGYKTYDDFLARFSSKRRNQLRRERKEMQREGITIATLRDEAIDKPALDAMYGFYTSTVDKFQWGRRYLNRAFFNELGGNLRSGVEIVLAKKGDEIIAGALNFAGPSVLYGRYWGARSELPFLHFNVCFYHSIEDCIERGLTAFEPGAGGRHKLSRGFEPHITHSVHHLEHPGLDRAVREFLGREREAALESVAQNLLAWR